MNPTQPDPSDITLSQVLRSWVVPRSTAPRFAHAVWRRIADEDSAPSSARPWSVLMFWLRGRLAQPRFAVAYVVVLVALGASAGAVRGTSQAADLADGLRGRYVLSIDPFASGPR